MKERFEKKDFSNPHTIEMDICFSKFFALKGLQQV